MIKILKYAIILGSLGINYGFAQVCIADAGIDLEICDGDGSSSNYTYLDGSASSISDGDINFEWTVLTVVGNGDDSETLVISNSESDEVDPRFKYPDELAENTSFLVQLRVYDDLEICEDFDTVQVYIESNMCPRAFAGDDQVLSNGCDIVVTLDGQESEDPQNEQLTFQWASLDGYDNSYFLNSDSSVAQFQFPETDSDRIFSFKLMVSDDIRTISDTIRVNYLDNDAPNADAGNNFSTCEFKFNLNGTLSYDINYNELSYSWTSTEGLEIAESASNKPTVTSPLNLEQDTEFTFTLEVNDGFCSTYDEVKVVILENICPVADGGETRRIPKYDKNSNIELNAANSFDPDGSSLSYEWTAPDGSITLDSIVLVSDLNPDSRFSEYTYVLKVMDDQNAISIDSVDVVFSYFSAPVSPSVYAVASHARVLVSWDASSEASYDSLSGYADFEGYKLYRSIDGGISWGGDDDKLYDFNGEFIGWKPYAQFDLDEEEDIYHCIYSHDYDCEIEQARQTIISGLDPLAPRFSLGTNTGIQYSYVDSNVVDGVEYTYTVTAYDIGLAPFSMEYLEIDSSGIFTSDTLWSLLNPGKFLGPDSLTYYDESGSIIRKEYNPNRGFLSLESVKGDSGDHNFITVIPGYTALDVSFPDADDIEALFTSNLDNIGTGDREYFIVDRNEIVRDSVKYEIQAKQKISAVDGMACEDPFVFGYVVKDTLGTPKATSTYYEDNLNFFEKDSISGLPGVISENGSFIVPQYDIITPVDRWSNQFKGIRFKVKNKIPLNPSAVPDVSIDTLIWNLPELLTPQEDSLVNFALSNSIFPVMSYTNIASYLRRLNFDYKIQFFNEPIGDTVLINNASGEGYMYFPFRITNMWTGKKVGLYCNDFGSLDASPVDFNNGAADYVWNSGEDIFLAKDTLKIAGTWTEKHNYNLDLFYSWGARYQNKFEFESGKTYEQGDTVFYKSALWVAAVPSEDGAEPLSIFVDESDDGIRNNPWRQIYPWTLKNTETGESFEDGAIELLVKPNKLFVDGDNWFSDMSKLGEKIEIPDTLCLDSIKVVPNPYKASSAFNENPNSRKIRFTHLPTSCQISIYTITGEHVSTFQHDAKFDGNAWWDLTNGHNQMVAPGLYIYVIEFPEEQDYCLDTFDDSEDRRGSKENDFYSNNKYDNQRVIEKTNIHIGKFAVIR